MTSFNATLASATDKTVGGRFDCSEAAPIDERFGVLYVAEDVSVAFWETQQYVVRAVPPSDPKIVFKSSLRDREFVYLMVERRLDLADVRKQSGAAKFNATPKELGGDDRLVTRAHAATVRREASDLHGMYYHSAAEGGEAIVLMSPACDPSYLRAWGDHLPMDEGLGLRIVRGILAEAGISLRVRR